MQLTILICMFMRTVASLNDGSVKPPLFNIAFEKGKSALEFEMAADSNVRYVLCSQGLIRLLTWHKGQCQAISY